MRLARTVLLTLSLALAWAAVALLGSLLDGFYPDWLMRRMPSLAYTLQWLPADLRTLGVWLALLASLLLAWQSPPGVASAAAGSRCRAAGRRAPSRTAALLLTIAGVLILALVVASTTPAQGVAAGGGISTAGCALGCGWARWRLRLARALAERGRNAHVVGDDGGAPERSWPWLLGVLAIATPLHWQNGHVPAALPTQSA